MKKLLLFAFMLCAVSVQAQFLGIKKVTEYVALGPLNEPLDSAGIPVKPDSAQIITYGDNGTTAAFSTHSTTYPFSDISLDTVKIMGDTTYWLVDQIQDIDGAGGNFSLAITVRLWTRGKFFADTRGVVQVVTDSLNTSLIAAVIAKDTAQAQDNWGAKEATITAGVSLAANSINSTSVASTGAAEIADAAGDSAWSTTVTPVANRTVTVTTNNDKTGYTAATVSDKTGYSLIQTFPTNFSDLAITSSTGRVTVGTNADKTGYTASTVSDKTGYSLATPPLTPSDTSALRANIAASIGPNVWTVAERDSILLALVKLDSANLRLDNIAVKIDSLNWLNANGPGAFSISINSSTVDSLKCGRDETLIWYQVYWHIVDGYPGKWPDSTRVYFY